MKKKILISTGGSGGHVVPAKIFYEHLKNEFDIIMTSDQRGMQFLDKNKYTIEIFDTPKIIKNIFLFPLKIFLLLNLTFKSFFFLRNKKIDILISTGGYMSLPLCVASIILKKKLFLFEPNMVLGRSNKFFINFCKKIFCYSENIKNLKEKSKKKISLIPVLLRKEFYDIKATQDLDKKVNLLVVGGSQGAKFFDDIIQNTIVDVSQKFDLKIFQQTSLSNYNYLKNFYSKNKIENELFQFNDNILDFMSRSNLCVTRAGASTLAELVFLNIPHIAIPLPIAKDNHQFENALFYQQLGCNWILNQREISNKNLLEKLINIIKNKEEYLQKKKNMKNFNYQNTWNNINQKIKTTINEN